MYVLSKLSLGFPEASSVLQSIALNMIKCGIFIYYIFFFFRASVVLAGPLAQPEPWRVRCLGRPEHWCL